MENKLSDLYQQVAQTAINMIPEEWTNVILYGEVSKELRKVAFYYYPKNRIEPVYYSQIWDELGFDKQTFDKLWDEIIEYLQSIQDLFINHGQEPWSNLTMRFDSNGKFSIEYHYDDFTDIDSYTTIMMWKHMIAKVPLKDSFAIDSVNEYVDYLQKRNRLYNNRPVQRIEQ
jgi:uncharacterized protein (TIGR01741 family)